MPITYALASGVCKGEHHDTGALTRTPTTSMAPMRWKRSPAAAGPGGRSSTATSTNDGENRRNSLGRLGLNSGSVTSVSANSATSDSTTPMHSE
ncbi:MAG: hypothetical protein R2736_06960 [Solirubrobacterales bacterium]